jgi:hypothetical protein
MHRINQRQGAKMRENGDVGNSGETNESGLLDFPQVFLKSRRLVQLGGMFEVSGE